MIPSKKLKENLAQIVSKVLNPFTLATIPFFFIAFQRNLFKIEASYISAILIIGVLGPIVQYQIFKKLNLVNDWDISDRTKRPLFTTMAGTIFLILFLISLLSVSSEIKIFTLSLTMTTYAFALISMFWKISGHLTYVSFTLGAMFLLTGHPAFIVTFLPILALVAWSRIVLKQHDIYQTIAGSILGVLIMLSIWYMNTLPLPF